jgi:hypothetical protein
MAAPPRGGLVLHALDPASALDHRQAPCVDQGSLRPSKWVGITVIWRRAGRPLQ